MSRDRGLTLLELVAATAIFALVAVMAMQALSGGLAQRRVIERVDGTQAELLRTLTLLRQDLEARVPLAHLPATGPAQAALMALPGGGFALSRGGAPALPGRAGDGFARVTWRVDAGAGRLTRRSQPLTGPGDPAAPEVALMAEVTGLRLIPRAAGIEVVIDTRRWGPLRVVAR